jgi:SAM-dependent methyltransferase
MADMMTYFFELYDALPRGGPGDNASTRKAFKLVKGLSKKPRILDLGCGPGMQTLELARLSKGKIIAIDNHQPFLDKLNHNAQRRGLSSYIETINQDMNQLLFPPESFDLIWSEGALYFMGFENGLKKCRERLRKNGHLAVTELVWLRPDPPKEIKEAHQSEYPALTDIENNLTMIKKAGYRLIGHFTLPDSSWTKHYYDPMEEKIRDLEKKYPTGHDARTVFSACQREIDLFRKYSKYFGYEFFVMQAAP